MAKPPGDVKKDRAWFERKVAELKAELEKLPADRREQAGRELAEPKGDVNMALFKRGEVWWYEFIFAGRRIRESAKTSRKTIAIQAERGRRLELEKTLAGLPVEKQENRINSVTGVVRKYLAHYEINHRAKSVLFAIGRLAHVAPGPHRRRGTGLPSRPGWRRRHRAVRSTWKWAS